MICPYLWGVYLHSCSAARNVYVPGSLELKHYCAPENDNRFSRCPNYRSVFWRPRPDQLIPYIIPDAEVK
jgi:hypothetical protein